MECLSKRATTYNLLFVLLFASLVLNCYAQLLPEEEAQTLETIAGKLLNISRSFCSSGSFENVTVSDNIQIVVNCSCNATVCHITNIQLKGQNLTGNLPEEFVNLTHLQQIDLSRNYFSGPIPTSYAQLPLTNLSLLGNRINGSIPKEIGDIATLVELVLEDNRLEGPLHQNLGNLSRLTRLFLSGNNFTGTIPDSFGNLKNLTDFRIDGSVLSGNIPALIGNWTKIDRLDMQGTSMDGPVPSTVTNLKNITVLRISDLNGTSMTFPDLREMKQLEILVLRNCLITGPIPDYVGGFTALKTLDLSFNMLTGQIPETFQSLKFNYMFLNNNSLSGALPDWITNSKQNIDVSYNNFTGQSQLGCQSSSVNFISSHSPEESNSVSWCLMKDLPCSTTPKYYSLFVNCGGGKTTFEGNEYEEDLATEGPSYFYSSSGKWAYSSTGVYTGNGAASYKANNTFALIVNGSEFYSTARLAPNSLKYYGLCLRKGSYKVRLHFAEIMFSDDQTFSSLGKRLFDVSIQGDKILKDFNIMEEAKGVGKGITMDFNDVRVNGSTLEIHLYWSGKGTTAIPARGVYGPLISAISVTPNFDPSTGLSVGVIVGIVVSSCVFLLLILVVLRMKGYLGGKDLEDKELRGALELQTGYFSLRQIKAATNFGLAKLDEEENTHISTRIAGTIGYMAPEYAMRGYLTDKADVYSFGIVALEIVSGKSNTNYRPKEEFVYLLDWAYVLQEQGSLLELVDPSLGSNYPQEEVLCMLNIALLCSNPSPTLRPPMSSVVGMLEGNSPIQAPLIKRGSPNQDLRFKAFERITQDSHSHFSSSAFSSASQAQRSMTMEGPWIDSSVSITSKNEIRDHSSSSTLLPDLHDVNLE
ncbi:hypothetical protein Vadar_031217 [Vaccinium darrowii]|uniref:Uncharacterized protein n=1 Tax=Vaccinium darrowii TaxID=229202 RepID=A0ACB7Z7W2_9ERIC|nr:hypothetical protein Vadar_031217 [Vaccinium darrowii]